MNNPQDKQHWANKKEAGFFIGMRFLFWSYRTLGYRVFTLALTPVVCYFFLFNRSARKASADYLQKLSTRHPQLNLKPSLKLTFRHFFSFSLSLLDKLNAWLNLVDYDAITFEGRDHLTSLIEQKKGAVIIGAHIGNLEVCRALSIKNPTLKLSILVHTKHANNFNSLLNQYSSTGNMELVQVTALNPSIAISLSEKVALGGVVVILADRTPVASKDRTVTANFLGHEALFPQGPFILASLLQCPVLTLFCIKQHNRHVIAIEPFANKLTLPRGKREHAITQYAQRFADILEQYCMRAPLQWYNMYDFWHKK